LSFDQIKTRVFVEERIPGRMMMNLIWRDWIRICASGSVVTLASVMVALMPSSLSAPKVPRPRNPP